jgi:transposase
VCAAGARLRISRFSRSWGLLDQICRHRSFRKLSEGEQVIAGVRLQAILDRCPELETASAQVRAFATMITELTGQDLPQRIAAARAAGLPGISSFAKGLEQDLDAVTNGLTMPWSSGPVEGRVNHIKMIKRQMFGRAGLPLLRKRVLLTARN